MIRLFNVNEVVSPLTFKIILNQKRYKELFLFS